MKKLLFVCTGNTCRSSMAEVLAKHTAQTIGLSDWQFASAGLAAFSGDRASEHAIRTMQEMGLNLSEHRATLISRQLLQEADLVLTMTQSQRNQLTAQAPGKVFTLWEFADGISRDVDDPFGGGLDVYRQAAGQIEAAIKIVMPLLMKKNV